MNTLMLRRLACLAAVLPLYTLIVMAAHAEPPATSNPPASAAPAPDDADDHMDWSDQPTRHGRFDWHARHNWRDRHKYGSELVNIGHDSNLPRGQSADSVVSIFGSSTSEGQAGNVVSVLGNTYVDGKVDDNAVAVLGNVELGPHAEIEGNVVAVGGTVQRDPAAIVHGNVQNIFGNFGDVGWLRTWIHHCLFYGRPLSLAPGLGWAWGLAFACLALYAALALLFREGLTRCVQTFETQPGQSVLAALIAMLLTPVLVVLLFVTVIGIAAVPFVVFGLFCAGLFGKAVMLAWLGRRVTGGRQDTGAMSHPAVAVLIGGVLVLAVYLVPVLGFLVYKLLSLLGLGAVVYTVILAVRAHQAAKGPRSSTGQAPMAGAPPWSPTPPSSAAAPAGPAMASGPTLASGPVPPADQPSASGTAPPSGAAYPPITAALPRAGFWVRMGALLLDALLVGILMGVLHVYHLQLPVLAVYGAIMWKTRGSTIGGIVFDLRVVRLDGREVDWETAIVRALSCFLSLAVVGLGFFWIAFDEQKQAWHDKIAGTVVVRVAKGTPLV
jgi:uncharacterized RDD family membrane protein YckC